MAVADRLASALIPPASHDHPLVLLSGCWQAPRGRAPAYQTHALFSTVPLGLSRPQRSQDLGLLLTRASLLLQTRALRLGSGESFSYSDYLP
jgi:hypothetical protein